MSKEAFLAENKEILDNLRAVKGKDYAAAVDMLAKLISAATLARLACNEDGVGKVTEMKILLPLTMAISSTMAAVCSIANIPEEEIEGLCDWAKKLSTLIEKHS